ncbi:polysaccharide export protein Wza [Haematobacter missouriensis]|uniref:Sugar ABC transporter substrate-binding protein n=1 Tax=Haematobacter missouriensis TaxID=366616 RepID=A0A212ARH9_9RHOB|nr:polysaccharide biosynthesis/export family protein [Haematobacter missouriensis]KFI27074.1 polysaccharide export protein Wza [Haematobacter missouriensis]OWJ78713.1 sugar ABC transporter substrate-binding protein [Haematobacter missouriensis]OWJ84045.1 sugar ABC transporter substrate-binding protein [Haematobacter missouriensis]
MRQHAIFFCLPLILTACTDGFVYFPVDESGQQRAAQEENVDIIRLTAENIGSFTQPAKGHVATSMPRGGRWNYLVGPGDILDIIVFDHPELTLPAGPQRAAKDSGFRVQADGSFFYPFIGQVRAEGRPLEQIREEVTRRLAEYVPEPQLEVRVAAFNSQSVVVSGEVKMPQRLEMTTSPRTLLEAISEAGGFTEDADMRRVRVQRGNQFYDVDVEGYLSAGMTANNPMLRSGDVVSVLRKRAQEAYLMGEISEAGPVDLSLDTVSLTQALALQKGVRSTRSDARGVFVFRNVRGRMTVFQLETSSPTGLLLGTRFVLEPGDVVYVTRNPLQRWNDTISKLLPTVQATNVVAATDGALR